MVLYVFIYIILGYGGHGVNGLLLWVIAFAFQTFYLFKMEVLYNSNFLVCEFKMEEDHDLLKNPSLSSGFFFYLESKLD